MFEGRINADPALTRDDVLAAITVNAAHQLRLEKQIGTIEAGKFADLIVLERDFLTVPDEQLGRNRVLLTMVGGEVVAALDAFAATVAPQRSALGATARVLKPAAGLHRPCDTGARAGRLGTRRAGAAGSGNSFVS